jgi:2-C-methyl-D-erythritol 2,4-cyclodiphosphate synthase
MDMLRQVAAMSEEAGLRIAHLDVTVVAESIPIAPHRQDIITRLAQTLAIGEGAISVKATTTDGLGFIGAGEGIAAVAVVTVEPAS